jgi:acetate---CoA ligase (ADP-forming)
VRKLFYPESVMVYGVSASPTNLSRNTVENLERFGFQGTVYMVGREGGELNGRKIYQHIRDIEAVPDLAVFLIPAKAIPDVLEQCGQKGIPFALIQSAGFSEYTDQGRKLEEKLLDIARRWNIRFMGPNCIGTINLDNGLILPFVPMYPHAMKKGHASLIAQSGGIVIDGIRLLTFEHIGFNKAVSIGNKLNINECDYLEFMISDPETHSIGIYLENFTDGRRLMELAGRTEKPIMVLKANRSASSHQIARFHTSALAGDDDVADAALKQAGIHRVRTLMDMADAFKIFSLPLMKGNKVGVVCRSGGQAVLLADAIQRQGFALAGFSNSVFDLVRKEIRAGVIRMTNPLDLGDVFDIRFYENIIEKVLQEESVDGVIFGHTYLHAATIPPTQELIRASRRLSQQYRKPVVFFIIASQKYFFLLKETDDFPLFADPEQAVQALALSRRHNENQSIDKAKQPIVSTRKKPAVKGPSEAMPAFMGPAEAFGMLSAYGLPVADFSIAGNLTEAFNAAEIMGYPVALKIAAPEILHKTEARGVHLNLMDREALADAFGQMNAAAGVIVQKMSSPGREVIIGGRQDREFGPVVLFGLGGIFVEVIRDVAMRICPIDRGEAGCMIEETKGSRILKGYRNHTPADRETLKDCLVKVSRLLVEHPEVQNLDINPMLIFDEGRGCLIVDVKIQIEKT